MTHHAIVIRPTGEPIEVIHVVGNFDTETALQERQGSYVWFDMMLRRNGQDLAILAHSPYPLLPINDLAQQVVLALIGEHLILNGVVILLGLPEDDVREVVRLASEPA
jgi:hypothetical protein